jgi:hypothetical protein
MADACRLVFEKWIPDTAKSELQRLANLPDADHRLLERLASYEVMRDEVWQKLPAAARGAEYLIIRRTYGVARTAELWLELEHIRKHTSLRTAKKVANFASKLRDAMEETRGDARYFWPSLWSGDVQITFESALSVVEQLATFYRATDVAYKGIGEASDDLSKLRKRNVKNAREIIFARYLASCFQDDFGKPLDPVVAAISSVVFDKEGEGALAPTIRGRRRSAPVKGTFAKPRS